MNPDEAKADFNKVYANLPVPEREQVIVVINDEEYSWRTAKAEIENETELGRKILKKLKAMEII